MEYRCSVCQKQFNSAEALTQHMKHAHPNIQSQSKIKTSHVIIGIIAVAAILLVAYYISGPSGKYDTFAKCISSSGAKFYGAWWCPHCKEQKALFGSSSVYLPYVECSTPDGNSQLDICKALNIEGYPTWIFPDNSRTNQLTLEQLSQRTNCPLPQ